MKKIILLASVLFSIYSTAQPVPKRVVLEHFTNTYCPPCSTRNPGLYANLAAHSSVYHVSYHPSAPYPSCTLYQHNPSENDARTNYYAVYGSTPRIALQGAALPSNTNFADTTIFNSALGQFTAFDMSVLLTQLNATTLRVTVNISKEDTSSLTAADVYGVIAEDTLIFTSNNNEPAHYDVFRKAIWSQDPQTMNLPTMVNTSVSFMQDVTINNAWDLSKVYAMVMLHSDTSIIQVARSNDLTLSTANIEAARPADIFPNPAEGLITLSGIATGTEIIISGLDGRPVLERSAISGVEILDVSGLSAGLYIISINGKEGLQHIKLLKQ